MADLASSLLKVNNIESAQLAPVSEATIQKIGGSINGLIDERGTQNARLLVLEGSPASTTYTGSAVNPATQTGTVFSMTLTGRPVLFIFNGGTLSRPVDTSFKCSNFTVYSWASNGGAAAAVGTLFSLIAAPTPGTYNFYFEKVNSTGTAAAVAVQITAIQV